MLIWAGTSIQFFQASLDTSWSKLCCQHGCFTMREFAEWGSDGWIDYSHNHVLMKLFSHALVATSKGHEAALEKLKQDIEEQKQKSHLE